MKRQGKSVRSLIVNLKDLEDRRVLRPGRSEQMKKAIDRRNTKGLHALMDEIVRSFLVKEICQGL